MARRKKSRSSSKGRAFWRKKFGSSVRKCHEETKTPKDFGRCMRKSMK